jgi:hypothetical protein
MYSIHCFILLYILSYSCMKVSGLGLKHKCQVCLINFLKMLKRCLIMESVIRNDIIDTMYKIFKIRTSHDSPYFSKKRQVIPSNIYDFYAYGPHCALLIPSEQFCSYL